MIIGTGSDFIGDVRFLRSVLRGNTWLYTCRCGTASASFALTQSQLGSFHRRVLRVPADNAYLVVAESKFISKNER